ncbi:MAG: transcription termination factor Rho [Bacteroidaceae bacterium]|nr:transcription termination factor Rho [Bacteroidaceae bacterium]
MYNLDQLNAMTVAELQHIAKEMGVKGVSGLNKTSLAYRILDEQAESAAASTSSAQTEKPARKRVRVAVKNVDRVYSANQDKVKKIDKPMKVQMNNSLYSDLSSEEQRELKKMEMQATEASVPAEASAPAAPEPAEPVAEAPKKRGRKKKEDTAQPPVAKAPEAKADDDIPDFLKESIAQTNDEASNFVVPEAAFDGAFARKEIVLKSAERRIDSKFIILQDVPPIESYFAPRNIFPSYDSKQPSKGAKDPASKKNAQQSAPEPGPAYNAPKQKGDKKAVNTEPRNARGYDFGDMVKVSGVLDTVDNYGFIRSSDYNYLPSPDDVYVSPQQMKQYGLKMGDVIDGFVRPPHDGEKFFPLTGIQLINGCDPKRIRDRVAFEHLTPLFPDEKFKLCSGAGDTPSSRIVDLFAPIGKGQRALIVAQPKTGKTMLMQDIANSIARNHPDAYLMMLLVDERPEEVTEMSRHVNAEVIASTFDAPAENHVKIAGIVLEKAKRMVECGHDVVIFLDSITRLARAYNTVSPASGKVLSGGVDANALHKPKRFFGAARNIEGGGSLTIIATALIDTGSKMDEVIFEEFKGTGNMELQLDRSLANKRVFPAVNLVASSTRRDDLLLDKTTQNRMWILRKHIADMTAIEAMDLVMNYVEKTRTNEEFLISMNG